MLLKHDCSCNLVNNCDPSIVHQGITGHKVDREYPRVSVHCETNNATRPILSAYGWRVVDSARLLSYLTFNFDEGYGGHTLYMDRPHAPRVLR